MSSLTKLTIFILACVLTMAVGAGACQNRSVSDASRNIVYVYPDPFVEALNGLGDPSAQAR